MQQKNVITKYWPTIVGEFYNPEHDKIKKKLLTFFEDYKKKNLYLEEVVKILIYMRVVMICSMKKMKICKKFYTSFQSVFFKFIKQQAITIFPRGVVTNNIELKLELLGLLVT